VVRVDLGGRRDEDEVGRRPEERLLEEPGELGHPHGEAAIGKEPAPDRPAAERFERAARLGKAELSGPTPASGVELAGGTVRHDEDLDERTVPEESGEGTAAAERLVVGVRCHREDAPRRQARCLVGEKTSLGEQVL